MYRTTIEKQRKLQNNKKKDGGTRDKRIYNEKTWEPNKKELKEITQDKEKAKKKKH